MGHASHCLALKKVEGPTGGPKAGGMITRRFPPGFMLFNANSNPDGDGEMMSKLGLKPGMSDPEPNRTSAGLPRR